MLAGHETTAHTLTIVLALLALYPNEQDTLFQQTQDIKRAEMDFVRVYLPNH
jgi:cytochrome P450